MDVGVRRFDPHISLTRVFAAAIDNPCGFDLTQYRACALRFDTPRSNSVEAISAAVLCRVEEWRGGLGRPCVWLALSVASA